MKAIDRKVLRDLMAMRAQIVTIALVVTSGIATFVSSLSTYDSLLAARDSFYRDSRFADAFASLRRAPLTLADRIAEIPGISVFELRIVRDSLLDIPDSAEAVVGRFISLPRPGGVSLNRLQLRSGRMPAPDSVDEVLVSEGFAEANLYRPGDSIAALFHGRYRRLRIVGTALSPEYIYAFRGQTPFPDDRHFGIFWMPREALAAAEDLEGAFNSVTLVYSPAAGPRSVLEELDRLLKPYGAIGAVDRSDQISHVFVSNEIEQQRIMALVVPTIFLSVAAFLINVVITRLVQTQRGQIATLKALGYSDATVALHYMKLVTALITPGALLGVALGAWFGTQTTIMYQDFFRFPELRFVLGPRVALQGVAVSLAAALAGGGAVLYRVLRTRPAEAMQPPAPPAYHGGWIEGLGLIRSFSVSVRLALRNLGNRAWRTLFSLIGIALALTIVILGLFWVDTINYIFQVQFGVLQHDDATVSFDTPLPQRALREIERYPGVLYAEGYRTVAVRLYKGHLREETAIVGLPTGARLRGVRDRDLRSIPLPIEGLLLGAGVAEKLGVSPGDWLFAEALNPDDRLATRIQVSGLAEELMGGATYMDLSALRRQLGEDRLINQVALLVDSGQAAELYRRLQSSPHIDSVATNDAVLRLFEESTAGLIQVFAGILIAFAVSIAFGVVYNTARVSLSERSWELATLRILGFTRAEVFRILAWELGLQTAPALLPGCVLGYMFVSMLMRLMPVEGIRFPVIVSISSFAIAILVVLIAGVISALLIYRRIKRLDMIAVLKTRE